MLCEVEITRPVCSIARFSRNASSSHSSLHASTGTCRWADLHRSRQPTLTPDRVDLRCASECQLDRPVRHVGHHRILEPDTLPGEPGLPRYFFGGLRNSRRV